MYSKKQLFSAFVPVAWYYFGRRPMENEQQHLVQVTTVYDIFKKSYRSGNERLVSDSQLGRELWVNQVRVTILQRQQRDRQCNGVCRILSTGSFHPVTEQPTGSAIRQYHPEKFSKLAPLQSSLKNCRAAASTNQQNNFGVSRKRFKPSMPGSTRNAQSASFEKRRGQPTDSQSASTWPIRPTVGRLGHVLADRQSVVQADGQPAPAEWQFAGEISVLMHRYMRPQENISQPEKFLTWKKFTYINGTVTVTVTVTINGLVKLSAFNAHICPSKYLASF